MRIKVTEINNSESLGDGLLFESKGLISSQGLRRVLFNRYCVNCALFKGVCAGIDIPNGFAQAMFPALFSTIDLLYECPIIGDPDNTFFE